MGFIDRSKFAFFVLVLFVVVFFGGGCNGNV